jgi:SAM-dependent methyltransferase
MLVPAAEGYRLWSAEYDRGPNPLLALEMRVLRERVAPLAGRTFLDAGTGTGRWMKYAAIQGARVLGIDLSGPMLSVAAEDGKLSGRVVLGDLRSLPFADFAADIAMCSFALSYLDSPAGVLSELARVARTVIVSDLHPAAMDAGWTRSFRAGDRVYEIEHFRHSARDLDDAARAAGLERKWSVDAAFGEPEREIFNAAGKPALFNAVCSLPAIHAACWVRRAD